MPNVRIEELHRVAVGSSSFYDDIYLPDGKAETVYNLVVAKVHSSYTVYKYRPDRTLEKSTTGTGSLRPGGR